MPTTKSEAPSQEKKGDRMKRHSEKTEEEELKPSKKKEQSHHHHHHSISKPPSAPTLQDSFNNSHSNHSFSDGDLQMVVASHSHESMSNDAIKVVKEAVNKSMKSTTVAVMAVENVEEGARDAADADNGVLKKVSKWYIVLLCLRIAAFLFCKIAFSVLASDRRKKVRRTPTRRWTEATPDASYTYTFETPVYQTPELDSDQLHWFDFQEFKYCLSVNVIGFVYSALQIFDLGKYFITKRHTMDPKLRGYLNFAMDQVMAYLLMSASSSAATTAHYWSYAVFEGDKFLEMAKASVALSFIAFVAFASSSIVSAFIFCRFN